jgi:hypothetical protein
MNSPFWQNIIAGSCVGLTAGIYVALNLVCRHFLSIEKSPLNYSRHGSWGLEVAVRIQLPSSRL